MIHELIDNYHKDATSPAKAVDGLTPRELDATPLPGHWSIRQTIMHLVDSDLIASDRMKRIIAEDNPTLVYCDETAAAQHLPYDQVDVRAACELFAMNRSLTAQLLKALPQGAFARCGTHSQAGRMTLQEVLQLYVEHVPHHLQHVLDKRAKLGKPLRDAPSFGA